MVKKAQPARSYAAYYRSTRQRTADDLAQEQVPRTLALRLPSHLNFHAQELNGVTHVGRPPLRYAGIVRISTPDNVRILLLHQF
jgi:hypothetical protein